MASPRLSLRVEGIIPPLVTPLLDRNTLDHAGLENLIGRIIAAQARGLFILGTTGEGPSLRYALRHELVEVVCEIVGGRLDVFVGVTDTSADESLEIAHAASEAGAAVVVLAPPYYWPMTQSELIDYTQWFADQSPLPLMLYNMPDCCKTCFEPVAVRELSQHDRIIGLKDSSGDLDYLRQCLADRGQKSDFTILVGPEELLLPAMRMGADGGVHGGANMFPKLYVKLYEALRDGNHELADARHAIVLQISRSIYSLDNAASRVIRGTKTALQIMGICSGYIAPPFCEVDEVGRRKIRLALERLAPNLETELVVNALRN